MIEQRSVRDIIDKKINFNVPAYQRGYRWNKLNVTDLLDDLLEFMQDDSSGKFYCLQPLVVKKIDKNRYNVIDGQQRLTTIFIILKYLENLLREENGIDEIYTLCYETRKDSKDFLQNIASKTQDESNQNMDYFCMYQAYEAIKIWFKNKNASELLKIFTNSEDERHIEFIWYEVEDSEDEVKIFARLNSGKIPLTNAELIKALFLNVRNLKNRSAPKECSENEIITKQIEISKEWDEIEYALQDDEFFKFLTKNDYPTRIELLFEILSGVKNTELDRYAIYRYFADMAKNGDGLLHLATEVKENKEEYPWGNIKKIFLTFKFWFKDTEYYHLVGFLVVSGISNIKEIYGKAKDETKSDFNIFLKKKIKEKIKIEDIDGLDYEKNRKDIENILLFFNIATILNNKSSNIRFSFSEFSTKRWSLEHIHAQNDKGLKDKKAQDAWLENSKKYIDESSLKDDVKNDLKKKIASFIDGNENNRFDELQMEILNKFGNMVNMHGIENLALLSADNNSSLSNGLFVDKRARIIEMDKNGEFIPVCTKNVFLKYYTKKLSDVYFWSEQDQKDYKCSIVETLKEFLGEENAK